MSARPVATGVGSMPGGDPLADEADNGRAYTEAVRLVLGELPDLAHLPELPGRGAVADMTGRAAALLDGLGADLQPAGWRLTDATGTDQRRARSLLARDLDTVEEHAVGYEGVFKVQVTGPWTLAATLEKPRGDKVLSDHGARREVRESLTEGIAAHVADVRRRLPGVTELVVQLDEPALPAVLAGRVPTASGWGKHRSVDLPEASAGLESVLAAVTGAGAVPVVHCCAADFPVALVRGAGARGVSVDLARLDASGYDALAEALEQGDRVLLGVVPSVDPAGPAPTDGQVTERVLRLLDMLGLAPSPNLVLTPVCGTAGATPAWTRIALETCRKAAANL